MPINLAALVHELPEMTDLDPLELLTDAAKQGLTSIVIVGLDEEGNLHLYSSATERNAEMRSIGILDAAKHILNQQLTESLLYTMADDGDSKQSGGSEDG